MPAYPYAAPLPAGPSTPAGGSAEADVKAWQRIAEQEFQRREAAESRIKKADARIRQDERVIQQLQQLHRQSESPGSYRSPSDYT